MYHIDMFLEVVFYVIIILHKSENYANNVPLGAVCMNDRALAAGEREMATGIFCGHILYTS